MNPKKQNRGKLRNHFLNNKHVKLSIRFEFR